MKTPIRRTRPLIEFVQIPNLAARDYRLSWRARGLLVELLSYPPGWETTVDDMVKRAQRIAESTGGKVEGREAMRTAANELARVGYIVRRRLQDERGHWRTETELSEEPLLALMLEQADASRDATSGTTSGNVQEPASRHGIVAGQTEDGFPGAGSPGAGFPGGITNTVTNTDEEERTAPFGRVAPPDARRASAGSSARSRGGFAASDKSQPRHTIEQKRAVQAVRDALPQHLNRALPVRTPRNVAAAVLEALAAGQPWERTPEQLVAFRVLPRWDGHWGSLFGAGEVERPVGALVEMLARRAECGDPRCDDRRNVDTGEPCVSCAVRREDRRATGSGEGVPAPLVPRQVPRGDAPLPWQTCDGCERAFRAAAPELCDDCKAKQPAA